MFTLWTPDLHISVLTSELNHGCSQNLKPTYVLSCGVRGVHTLEFPSLSLFSAPLWGKNRKKQQGCETTMKRVTTKSKCLKWTPNKGNGQRCSLILSFKWRVWEKPRPEQNVRNVTANLTNQTCNHTRLFVHAALCRRFGLDILFFSKLAVCLIYHPSWPLLSLLL